MERKDALIKEMKVLRERYNNEVKRFNYFMNCLLVAKEDIRQGGSPDVYETYEDALKRAILEYKSYKFCVKFRANELKELKTMIRQLDREIRNIKIN